jgi:hypothetical protein
VELGIRKLDFVDNVEMNLEHTEGKVTFKPGMEVSVEKIARAVVDAGFSVRYLKAGFVFNNVAVSDNSCFNFDHHNFQFIKTGSKTLNGVTEINFLGKNFQAPSDYKKWKADLKPACTKPKEELLFVTL